MEEKYLAMYLRLSSEDDLDDNAAKDESNSITSQREIIRRFIREHEELQKYQIVEFVDDGYTGTNFDRPNVQKMLTAIRAGKISLVIVKDFSRFGRNFLEVGDYLEHIFPYLGLRFISVNDNYDSNNYIGTTAGIDVAFKNFIYEQYSKDLSVKVKSTQHMMMKKGKYVTHCPYGYMKVPGVKHQMVPDPRTAPIVREIFLMAISGKKTTEIARNLNERNIPTPMTYKNWDRKDIACQTMWSHQAVLRIIKDYKYTGAMVNFKCENLTIRAKAQHRRNPEEYVITEDMHEPIVSHEEYYAANDSLRKVAPRTVVHYEQRDRVYYCGHCGRRLRKTFGSDEYYSCATQMYIKDAVCRSTRWSRTDIEKIVFSSYKAHLQFLAIELAKVETSSFDEEILKLQEEQQRIERSQKNRTSDAIMLYEEYRAGKLSKEQFIKQKADNSKQKEYEDKRIESLNIQIEEAISKRNAETKRMAEMQDGIGVLGYSDDVLLDKMYDAIERVTVYANREIEIQWKFGCDFSQCKGA